MDDTRFFMAARYHRRTLAASGGAQFPCWQSVTWLPSDSPLFNCRPFVFVAKSAFCFRCSLWTRSETWSRRSSCFSFFITSTTSRVSVVRTKARIFLLSNTKALSTLFCQCWILLFSSFSEIKSSGSDNLHDGEQLPIVADLCTFCLESGFGCLRRIGSELKVGSFENIQTLLLLSRAFLLQKTEHFRKKVGNPRTWRADGDAFSSA